MSPSGWFWETLKKVLLPGNSTESYRAIPWASAVGDPTKDSHGNFCLWQVRVLPDKSLLMRIVTFSLFPFDPSSDWDTTLKGTCGVTSSTLTEPEPQEALALTFYLWVWCCHSQLCCPLPGWKWNQFPRDRKHKSSSHSAHGEAPGENKTGRHGAYIPLHIFSTSLWLPGNRQLANRKGGKRPFIKQNS
jgi:hypothetical protein